MKDFLNWLEQLKAKAGSGSDGIVLLYHEERKFIPYMILESLKKYGLLDRFTKTVKSFANSLNLAKASIGDTNIKNYSLRKLSKLLSKSKEDVTPVSTSASVSASGSGSITTSTAASEGTVVDNNSSSSSNFNEKRSTKNGVKFEREQFDGNASVRAKMAFNVALQLSNADRDSEPGSSEALENLFNALKPFANLVMSDVQELDTQNENLERQNSFRPVFLNYFKTTLYHRVRAVKFRIVLAENGFDLNSLNAIWTDKSTEGLDMALQTIGSLKTEDKTELLELLDSFFDPNKTTIKPVVKSNNNNNNRRRNRRNTNPPAKNGANSSRSTSTEFGAGGDKSQSVSSVPDSTTKSPSPNKSAAVAGRPQRKRNSRHSLGNGNEAKVSDAAAPVKAELNNTAPAAIQPPSPSPVAIAAST